MMSMGLESLGDRWRPEFMDPLLEAEAQIGELREELASRVEELSAVRAEQNALRIQVDELRTERDALRIQVDGLRTERNALMEACAKSTKRERTVSAQLSISRRSKKRRISENEKLAQENIALQRENKRLRNHLWEKGVKHSTMCLLQETKPEADPDDIRPALLSSGYEKVGLFIDGDQLVEVFDSSIDEPLNWTKQRRAALKRFGLPATFRRSVLVDVTKEGNYGGTCLGLHPFFTNGEDFVVTRHEGHYYDSAGDLIQLTKVQ